MFLTAENLGCPPFFFFSNIFNKMITLSQEKVKEESTWGPPCSLWRACLWPKFWLSLAPSFHRPSPKTMHSLDGCTQKTNVRVGKKIVLVQHLFLLGESDEKSKGSISHSNFQVKAQRPFTNDCNTHPKFYSGQALYTHWTCHSYSFLSVP